MRLIHRCLWHFTPLTFVCLLGILVHAEEKKLHSAIDPVSRDRGGWMGRHEKMNERVKQGNVDLVFIGDSITQGWEGNGKGVWKKYYGKRNAVNLGIRGDRTQHVLWRLDHGNLDDISPKLAVVMIGTNNSRENTPEEIADGVEAIVGQLRSALPETKVLLLAIFPRGENGQDERRRVNQDANERIAKLNDGMRVKYLDIGQGFLEDDGTLTREIMPDLLHLSEKGYTIWADAIESAVAEALDKK